MKIEFKRSALKQLKQYKRKIQLHIKLYMKN